MTGQRIIEQKLENGVQVFSAKEVKHLLNEIRIYQHIVKTLREEKGTK
jgi:hypothetical protein